jgi:hypothetical protein
MGAAPQLPHLLRLPGYFALDSGLVKTFHIGERQGIQLKWETFNVTNSQFLAGPSGFGVSPIDPFIQAQFGMPAITSAPTTSVFYQPPRSLWVKPKPDVRCNLLYVGSPEKYPIYRGAG